KHDPLDVGVDPLGHLQRTLVAADGVGVTLLFATDVAQDSKAPDLAIPIAFDPEETQRLAGQALGLREAIETGQRFGLVDRRQSDQLEVPERAGLLGRFLRRL